MLEIRELTTSAILLRIFVALLLGGILGLERGLKNRPAGMRTYMLVCMGACVVMITNQYVYQAFDSGDPVRMGAQVVSGIGFLGAGTIIVTARNQIKGLTTAAGLWASACLGLAVGIGLYEVALAGGIATFAVLTGLQEWDFHMRRNTRMVDVYVELNKDVPLGEFLRNTRDKDIELSNLQVEHDNGLADDILAFIVTIKGKKQYGHDELLRTVRKLEGVAYLEEL